MNLNPKVQLAFERAARRSAHFLFLSTESYKLKRFGRRKFSLYASTGLNGDRTLLVDGLHSEMEAMRVAKAIGAYHEFIDTVDRERLKIIFDKAFIEYRERVDKDARERPLLNFANMVHAVMVHAVMVRAKDRP